jgi:hypothetical protein
MLLSKLVKMLKPKWNKGCLPGSLLIKRYGISVQAFLLIIVFFLISCNKKNDTVKTNDNSKPPSYNIELKKEEQKLSFELNSQIVNRSVCLMPYVTPDSIRYLFYRSGYSNNICVFNIDNEKLINTIKLENRGPNGVGSINGFEVINFDSIYINSAFIRKLFLVNQQGKIISKIDYSSYQQEYFIHAATSRTLENMRVGFKDLKIYLPFYPGYDKGNYHTFAPEDIRFIAELDTLEKTANTLKIGFPENYWQDDFYPSFFGFFIENGCFYINYMYDNKVLFSVDSDKWVSIEIPSRYANVKRVIPRGNGLSARYIRLIFDPFRDVFYRFVMHEQRKIENRVHTDLIRYPQRFSIIILDNDLNIIGETIFPPDTYDPHGFFIAKEGLYISKSNPFNPDYNVDLLEFQLFNLSEK